MKLELRFQIVRKRTTYLRSLAKILSRIFFLAVGLQETSRNTEAYLFARRRDAVLN